MLDKIFIIIVTYNGMPWIEKCLLSCDDFQVIVVDNNSKDQTVHFIKENFRKTIILEQVKNLGFGTANNIGMKYALKNDAEAVFLLNQDAYLQENTITELYSASRDNLKFGLLSPIHLNGAGDKLDFNFSNYLRQNNRFYSDAVLKRLNGIYEVPFVNAAGWYIPKKTLLDIGGFDPIYFHYGEDDHYCQRLRFHGMKIGVLANAFMRHDRENRSSLPIKSFSENFYKMEERLFKLKIADPNNLEFKSLWNQIRRNNYRSIISTFLKGNFESCKGYLKLFRYRKLWFRQSNKSRNEVVKLKRHYL